MSKPPETKRGSAAVATAIVFAVLVIMAAIIVGSLIAMWLKGS